MQIWKKNKNKNLKRSLAWLEASASGLVDSPTARRKQPGVAGPTSGTCRRAWQRRQIRASTSVSISTHQTRNGRERERGEVILDQFPRLICRTASHRPRRGADHHLRPACADMGRRGSSDRLEALSLEIERKLQKVTHRFPFPPSWSVRRLGSARSLLWFCGACCSVAGARIVGVLNIPSICVRRAQSRLNLSRAHVALATKSRAAAWGF